jgi:hypothetical protein
MEATDLKANPEEMECELEHWEVHKEDVIVKLVKGQKKRHRDWHLAAGQRGELKELTRGDCGSRRKLAAACRKILCSSGTVQGKCLQENLKPGKLWTMQGIGRSQQEGDLLCRSGTAQRTQM